MADETTFWDKVKDYIGIGLTKTKEAGEYLKKTGREPETNLQDAVSKPFRNSSSSKSVKKKKYGKK